MSTKKKIGIAVVLLIASAIAFYFLYWIKTPTYSIGLIREAIQKHDVAAFERHVDLDTLYNKGFDDALIAFDKIEGRGVMNNPFAVAIIKMFKPGVVDSLKAQTIEEVKGTANTDKAKREKTEADQFAKTLQKKSDSSNLEIKDFSVVTQESSESVVAVKLYNKKLNKSFDLKVKMAKLDDGTWRVKEAINLVEFLVEVDKAEKAMK